MANLTKDQRILKENTDKSPYELLKLGLSEKKYQELLKEEPKAEPTNAKEAEKQQLPEKLIPEVRQSQRAIPKLAAHTAVLGGNATIKGPNGKKTSMDRNRAIKFVRKNPTYKIID